jgi:hypothetical protein
VFYDFLCPEDPRCLMETQFTNKRINVWCKHHRYGWSSLFNSFFHELIHIFFRLLLSKDSLFDDMLDDISYWVSFRIHFKDIVACKGWRYVLSTSRRKMGVF